MPSALPHSRRMSGDALAIALARALVGAAAPAAAPAGTPAAVQLRAIARAAPALQLLGDSDAAAGEVDEVLAAESAALIAALPAALATRTYLAGHALSVADIRAFAAVKG